MSFRDFDKGIPAAQIRMKQQQDAEQQRIQQQEQEYREMLERFKESEHRLSILRTISTGNNQSPQERLTQWLQALKEQNDENRF